jgi:hypothetical protein
MCDCELPDFYRETRPIARKEHRCCECRRPIRPGTEYLHIAGKWNGDVQTFRRHLRCHRVSLAIEKGSDCCVPFGEMRQELREHTRQNRRERQWARGWRPRGVWGELYPPEQLLTQTGGT